MKARMIVTVIVAAILLLFVFFSQVLLERVATDLAEDAEEICDLLRRENTGEGEGRLDDLLHRFRSEKWVFCVFGSDLRVYELNRSLLRARALAEEGEWSPALEALSDFVSVLREIARTHRPTLPNIF